MIAPKPPSLDFGSTAPFHYLGTYPNIHRASSTTSFGLGIHHPQYIMSQIPPDQFFAQSSMGMVPSPSQINQPGWFDFRVSSNSPPQPPTAILPSPRRRHTAYARIEDERPVVSPTMPFASPSSELQPGNSDKREAKAEQWFPDETDFLVAEPENEDDSNSGIRNPGLMVANCLQAPVDLYGTQIRSFQSLAGENILTNYSPSSADTPLNNRQTAAVFRYFVTVTAPALSMFERNPLDPSRMFSGQTIPRSHQHIWTCEFSCHVKSRSSRD